MGGKKKKPAGKTVRRITRKDRFIQEVEKDPTISATQAAKNAGYSAKTAYSQGSRLLKSVEVQEILRKFREEQQNRVQVSSDAVLRELARIAQSDISEAFNEDGSLRPLREIPIDVRRAISSSKIRKVRGTSEECGEEGQAIVQVEEIRFWDKNQALHTLAKHFKLLTDRVEIFDKRSLADRLRKARERTGKHRSG